MKKRIVLLLMVAVMGNAYAASFSVRGKIKFIQAGNGFSGCLVTMDKRVGSACYGTQVSLDCKGEYTDKSAESGMRKFALALSAAQNGQEIVVSGDDNNKVSGNYCVATKVYVIY